MSNFKGVLEVNARKEATEELAEMRLKEINNDKRKERGHLILGFVLIFVMCLSYIEVLKFEKPSADGLPGIEFSAKPITDFIATHPIKSSAEPIKQNSRRQ